MQLKLVKKKKSLSAVYISEEIKDFSDQAVNMSAAKLDSFFITTIIMATRGHRKSVAFSAFSQPWMKNHWRCERGGF